MWTRPRDSAGGGALAAATYVFVAVVRLKALPSWAILVAMVIAAIVGGAVGALASWFFGRKARASGAGPVPSATGIARATLRGLSFLVLVSSVFFVAMRDVGGRMGVTSEATLRDLVVVPVFGIAVFVVVTLVAMRATLRDARVLLAIPIALAVSAMFLGSPAQDRRDADVVVPPPAQGRPARVIVAIDGLGAEQLDRYRDRMPNLDAFAKQAARGEVDADPPMLSAAIWTAIATGLPMKQHKISTYELYVDAMPSFRTVAIDKFFEDPSTSLLAFPIFGAWRLGLVSFLPATRFHRRGDPFWKTDGIGRVAVVCWPATWPAEPVAGVMISDRWPPEKSQVLFHHRTNLPAQVWPKDFEERLRPLQRKSGDAPDPDLLAMAELTPDEIASFMADQTGEPQHVPKQQPFSNAYFGWLNDRSCFAAARTVLDETKPDVLAVYLIGADLTAHALAPAPDGLVPGFDATDSARLSAFMGNYWARLDRDLAWLLDAGDTTIVLSDHGLEANSKNILFGNWHAGHGIVLARGDGFAAGAALGTKKPEEWRPILLGNE